jgi:hypothetical protein
MAILAVCLASRLAQMELIWLLRERMGAYEPLFYNLTI